MDSLFRIKALKKTKNLIVFGLVLNHNVRLGWVERERVTWTYLISNNCCPTMVLEINSWYLPKIFFSNRRPLKNSFNRTEFFVGLWLLKSNKYFLHKVSPPFAFQMILEFCITCVTPPFSFFFLHTSNLITPCPSPSFNIPLSWVGTG